MLFPKNVRVLNTINIFGNAMNKKAVKKTGSTKSRSVIYESVQVRPLLSERLPNSFANKRGS